MRKPEERIYHAAIHATGLFANEILFVDDQMRNIIPAQSIGMATHHFRNAEDLRRALREHSVEVDNGC
ncbi:TPA: HAD-IA family hydrolase [Candidatus Woesearchaeota archaeon]|nr:HAD-IA family hydrolase [Candidatus Woesearchaeota archaeon]